ncbi:S-adenosyl-L-methionine-dependent methyltransferase [Rickenella mellea]|uniref:S-adenosyl-L-methionine-dependent methyltransferase n=1 Tax=Rickenella mellea TaxID=50990 RepID=A0A4Y7QLK1_9AGAM|nr:S-adenosyl-L-methionine-dependent methyltransferase [Rickenella mellea]
MANGRLLPPPESPQDPRRRSMLIKQSQFLLKHGKRHHSFDREKAPYPLNYDKETIDLDVLDHLFFKQMKQSVSYIDLKDGHPERSLDLGCGSGAWVLDAAKEWPDCQFVGFDLVNMQPPICMLDQDPSLKGRIQWVHGNFLTTKLPFDDDEFDHIHIQAIARTVPENKWPYLFEEVFRVLSPGGAIEMIEEDITFPVLPRWYTAPLRSRERRLPSIHLPDGARVIPPSPPLTPPPPDLPHDHALLESLYNSVYESRFINREPTSILPSYFSTYFRQVLCSPVINFPMPPVPLNPSYKSVSASRLSSSPSDRARMYTHRKSSSSGSGSSDSKTEVGSPFNQERTPPTSDCDSLRNSPCSETFPSPVQPYYSSPSDDTSIGYEAQTALLPMSALSKTTDLGLALHLHRSCHSVLACQESMWEELKDRIRNREEQLKLLGWNDEELEGHRSRQRFETLIDRYKSDMQARIALWQPITNSLSWKVPHREPLSKSELIEEERLHKAMLQARKHASLEESKTQCRRVRIFVGYKASS